LTQCLSPFSSTTIGVDLDALGVAVDGGKDSLSMAAKVDGETVKAPGALVVTTYAACPDVSLTVTPDLKSAGSALYLIDVTAGRKRLGGTALAQTYSQLGSIAPDIDDPLALKAGFELVQELVAKRALLSGHDVSDGGLLTALLEMAFAGNLGLDVTLPPATHTADGGADGSLAPFAAAFAEEPGFVIEVAAGDAEAALLAAATAAGVPAIRLGVTTSTQRVVVGVGGDTPLPALIDGSLSEWRDVWEATSFELEKLQCEPSCVAQEQASLATRTTPAWTLSFDVSATPASLLKAPSSQLPNVAVIRQEGSNGDREMCAALHAAGLAPWDVAMADLVAGTLTLDRFRGVVFVGGFSYADVLGSAKGWAAVLKFNAPLWAQLVAFRKRTDVFSLGVCNGCQLMALLGWVPSAASDPELPLLDQPRFVHNASGRFESRFSSVEIGPSPAVLLKGMEGTRMGVWVAHGEGRAHFPRADVLDRVLKHNLAPIRYVNDVGEQTQAYPFNPNGSPHAIAALCSTDGRHLAMMPHPERCFQTWQWPWKPTEWGSLPAGPWIRLFQNAQRFCAESSNGH